MITSSSPAETPSSLRDRIESSLDTIRPALHIDGGDVEFVGVDDSGVLQLRLLRACGACPISSVTVKHGIERRVRAMVPEVSAVQTV